jgi:hypothetical protein
VRQIPRLLHLPPPSGVFPVRFDRFSPYHVAPEQWGLDLVPLDFYQLIYPFPSEVLERMAYYFRDRDDSQDYFRALGEWLPALRAGVGAWNDRWSSTEPPGLYFSYDDADEVVDTRTGRDRLLIGALGGRLLRALEKRPLSVAGLASALKDAASAASVEGSLHELEAMGLVFCERDRFLSLVHRRRPSYGREAALTV